MKKSVNELRLWLAVGFAGFSLGTVRAAETSSVSVSLPAQLWIAPGGTRGENLDPKSLTSLAALQRGDYVVIPLLGGEQVTGKVNLVQQDDGGWVRVGGELTGLRAGSFSVGNSGRSVGGTILLPQERLAYVIQEQPDGQLLMQEKPLSEVICFPLPRPTDEPVAAAGDSGPQESPPILSSRPEATAVLYLDFDGETVTEPTWNSGNTIVAEPAILSSAQMTEVWNRVKEDYWPFNIDVTTDVTRYNNAPVGRRMRCIFTRTCEWFNNCEAGGVARINSFDLAGQAGFSSTIPCWVFVGSVAKSVAEAASHELGHTLGLGHDGRTSPAEAYYEGHGGGDVGWAPIMGTGYDRQLVQWSKGEYAFANNQEDDLAIIADAANGFGYVADEAGNSIAAAAVLNAPDGAVNQMGTISGNNDVDFYVIDVGSGNLSITATPATPSPNLDIQLELRNSAGTVLTTSNPDTLLNAAISYGAAAGSYFVKVQGTGRGDVANGYSSYGSIGYYSLTGTVPLVPPAITTQPVSQTNIVASTVSFTVAASGSPPLSYQWRRNGVSISGATNASYSILNVQPNQAGNYTVVVSNARASVTSTTAVLVVNVPPSITAQPQNRTVTNGNSVTFTVTASGTAPLSYQWYRNNSAVAGATTASYTNSAAQPSDAGDYKVRVSNVAGIVESAVATLTVQYAPVITAQPQSQTVIVGDLVIFSANADANPTSSYQWRFNGNPIPTASQATYTITSVSTSNAGNYSVTISNSAGQTNSESATLAVLVPYPGIYNTGLSHDRTVLADGQVDPHYKLVLNPNIPASSNAIVQDSTKYPLVAGPWVQNTSKSKWIGPFLDTTQASPGNYTYQLMLDLTGYDPTTAFLAGNWSSDDGGSLFLNGTDTGFRSAYNGFSTFALGNGFVSGTNLIEFRVFNAPRDWTGLRVENLRGTAQFLTNLPLRIVVQPIGGTKAVTDNIVFSVLASGIPPLSYQWYHDGIALADKTNASLALSALTTTNAGGYMVRVSDAVAVTNSELAELVVIQPEFGIFNTGVSSTGTALAPGQPDPHYVLISSADAAYGTLATYAATGPPIPPWVTNNTRSCWIAPRSDSTFVAPGEYRYRLFFTLESNDVATASINGNVATDDGNGGIYLNGNPVNFGASGWEFNPLVIPAGSPFVAGLNALDFVVRNGDTGGSNPSGLRVDDLVLTGITVKLPTLTISLSNNNFRVAWPVSATGFVLQETTALPGNWKNSSARVTVQWDEYVAVLRNSPPLVAALAAIQTISLNGNNIAADSFDSADVNYSDPGGFYPVNFNKTKANGDVAAGYGIIDSLGVGSLVVKGSVRTGSVTNTVYIGANGSVGDRAWVEGGNYGVQTGHYADDMNVVWDPVILPDPNPVWAPVLGNPGVLTNYKTNGITYDFYFIRSADYLVYGGYISRGVLIAPNVNVRLWVSTGDIKIPGTGEIRIPVNASLQIFMGGALFSVAGSGIVNESGYAVNFQYYGLPTNTRIDFQGNGDFTGCIYAPNADFYLGGGGSGMVDFIGSSITKNVTLKGHYNFHYDENLQRIGLSVGPGTVKSFRLRK